MTIYVTTERKVHGRQNYYRNEYRMENGEVVKYKCRFKKKDRDDTEYWNRTEEKEESWIIGDPNMPQWLREAI